MSSPEIMSTNKQEAFVSAKPLQGRLVSERATSASSRPKTEPKQVELHTDTSSSIAIGLDDPVSPTFLRVEIEFRVVMKQPEIDRIVAEYEAKHEMEFTLIAWVGFTDWTNIPTQALTPYVAMVHDVALRRAEITLHEMGIRGAGLPRPASFETGNENAANTNRAA